MTTNISAATSAGKERRLKAIGQHAWTNVGEGVVDLDTFKVQTQPTSKERLKAQRIRRGSLRSNEERSEE